MAAGNVVSRPGSDLSGGLPMQFEPLGQDGHFANGWLQAMAKLSDAMRGYWGFRKVTGGIGQQQKDRLACVGYCGLEITDKSYGFSRGLTLK